MMAVCAVHGLTPYQCYGRWVWYNRKTLLERPCSKETEKAHAPPYLWKDLIKLTYGEYWVECGLRYRRAMGSAWGWGVSYASKEDAQETLSLAAHLWDSRGGKPLEYPEGIPGPAVQLIGDYVTKWGGRRAIIRVENRDEGREFRPPVGFRESVSAMPCDWTHYAGPYESLPEELKWPEPIVLEAREPALS